MKPNAFLVMLVLASGVAHADETADALASLPHHIALDAHTHVSGQPTAEAISKLRAAGITTVIDLRPVAETPDLDEKKLAGKAGLKFHSLPIAGAEDLTRDNVNAFDRLLKDSAKENVLLHCSSGNRVGAMLALRARWVEGKSVEESLAIGKAAGMTGLTPAVTGLLATDVVSGASKKY